MWIATILLLTAASMMLGGAALMLDAGVRLARDLRGASRPRLR